ncbi:MAG: hypothetical protein ACI4BD_08675 [Paludibacteraceae bacterium]
MTHKMLLFAALVCVLGWCCVSCESNDPNKTSGGSSTYVAKGFSISTNKQVVFSPGNLQYQASTDTWRFANHQYDYVGELNVRISPTNENWIDLFGWGTGNNPTNISNDNADYATFVDWGTNKIGKYRANTWRTLTEAEWEYLLSERNSAAVLWGIATINNIHGLILLPDDFTLPEDMIFVAGDDYRVGWALNVYTSYEWSKMEQNGAVFLPNAGDYWSATPYESDKAWVVDCYSGGVDIDYYRRYYGQAVRLVQDL